MATFGKFVLYLALCFPVMYIRAYALTKLYAWFVVTTFHVAPITPAQAYGVAMTLHLAVVAIPTNITKAKDDDSAFVELFANAFLALFVLGIGWMVQRWWL